MVNSTNSTKPIATFGRFPVPVMLSTSLLFPWITRVGETFTVSFSLVVSSVITTGLEVLAADVLADVLGAEVTADVLATGAEV
jgi:hypothetical protein